VIVRVAARGIVHDANLSPPEVFPLRVLPGYRLKYDSVNSLPNTAVEISGPLPGTGFPAVEFLAVNGAQYGAYGISDGIDGTGGPTFGFEIQGGDINLLAHAGPPVGSVPSIVAVQIDSVSFEGEAKPPGSPPPARSVNCLNIQALAGGRVTMTVANCSFSTETDLTLCPNVTGYTGASPAVWTDGQVPQNPALIYIVGTELAPNQGTFLQVTLSNALVLPLATVGPVPEVTHGIRIEQAGTTILSSVTIERSTVEGNANADPAVPEGISVGICHTPYLCADLLQVFSTIVQDCGQYGILTTPLGVGPVVPVVELSGNKVLGNGTRANPVGNCQFVAWASCTAGSLPSVTYCLPGAGIANECLGPQVSVGGTIDQNELLANRVGLSIVAAESPGSVGAPGLMVKRNHFEGQVYAPPLLYCDPTSPFPCSTAVYYSGTGVLISAQNNGQIDLSGLFDSNMYTGNEGRGVLIASRNAPGGPPANLSPVLVNERIWSNGTVAAAGQDGATIFAGATGAGAGPVQPLFVNCTIWGNPGFAVNNLTATSEAILWNSIAYGNHGGAGDLNGFVFPSVGGPALGDPRTVNYSDFCGSPWDVMLVPCGSQLDPALPHFCISAPPMFVGPPPPGFELTCGGGGTPPGCVPPCFTPGVPGGGSRCIDRANSAAPFFPIFDAKGAFRSVGLNSTTAVPDMGALEKQTCTP
jgi:hypothetical protein